MKPSDTLTDLLTRLAEAAPDVCQRYETIFTIGDYSFDVSADEPQLIAQWHGSKATFTGQPALAWLQGAVQQACEARGMTWEADSFVTNKGMRYQARISEAYQKFKVADSPAVALLAALVEAVEGRKESR